MNNTQTLNSEKPKSTLLLKGLRGNAIFSTLSGAAALIAAPTLSTFTGITPPAVFYVLGIVLLIYAVDLWWVSSKDPIDMRFAWAAIILDILWVLGSVFILFFGLLPLTVAGRWTVFFLAEIVAIFAIIQYIGVRRANP